MAKNTVNGVSMRTFAEHYHRTLKSGGTIKDLQESVEMVNEQSVRQKIVALKKAFPNLPSLKRQGRSANSGKTAAQEAAELLSDLFAEDAAEAAETAKSTESSTEKSETAEATV